MALGPMEIHHKEFNTVRMGGYNKEEVDTFLDQVADELERQLHRSQELMGMVESMRARVAEYDGMQQTLQNALINAQKSADGVVSEAQSQADVILQGAQSQAESMLGQAEAKAVSCMEEANRSRDTAIQEAYGEKDRITADLSQLREAATEYIASLRGLLDSTSRTVSEYESRLKQAEQAAALAANEAASPVVTPVIESPPAAEAWAETETMPAYETPEAPAEEPLLYIPPAAEPLYQEPAYQEQAPDLSAEPLYQEPAYQEQTPDLPTGPLVPEQAYQEPEIEAVGMLEQQAYVPNIEPMEEIPEEDSPIRTVEPESSEVPGPIEPQAFVPNIHLENVDLQEDQPAGLPNGFPPPEEAPRSTLEDLAGTGAAPFIPEVSPVSPADVEQQFAPPPEKEEKGEKHFFWE